MLESHPSLQAIKSMAARQHALGESGEYLCTDMTVILSHEPCPMCAMALVHARAARVIFVFDNVACGAFCTKLSLQSQASFNHHYDVFRAVRVKQ